MPNPLLREAIFVTFTMVLLSKNGKYRVSFLNKAAQLCMKCTLPLIENTYPGRVDRTQMALNLYT